MTNVITDIEARTQRSADLTLQEKRVAMVMFSTYPADPRPRRAVDTLLREGMNVDLICLADESSPNHEIRAPLDIRRVPIKHRRGSKLCYAYNYSAFIVICAAILAFRSLRHRYDLIYVHNMPDILVLSSLVPKVLGAKVILDQHDPMPELMMSIFDLDDNRLIVRLLRWLEKWSIALADRVITVNMACKQLFASRSCLPEKISVVMNAPDGSIFPFRAARSYPSQTFDKPFVMMYHGSLVRRNGLDLAIDALALARASIPNVELRVYGRRTAFLDHVLERAEAVRDSVHYLGPKSLEELVGEIESCDLGIVPNHRNPFTEVNTPTRIFEYLAVGKPVIAPRTAGILDYFGEKSLVYFEPGNAKDLAVKMEHAFYHYGDLVNMTEQGQKVYLGHTWSHEEKTLVYIIKELLNGGSPRHNVANLTSVNSHH